MKRKILVCISLISLACIFALGNYEFNKVHNITYNTKISDSINKKEEIATVAKRETEKEVNSDIIGSIKIKGTNIDYKVVQTSNNEYYLNHSITKKKNAIGSIFLDYRNNPEDRKLLIYGHNSRTLKSAPFHDLEKYLDKIYLKNHKYVTLNINNHENVYEIFSIMVVTGNNHMKVTFNDKEYIKHIKWMKDNSLYDTGVDVGLNDKILTLQTCYYNPDNSYLLVNAKKIK